ncbi:MAG: glycosyl transferase family 1, partial [Megasphaera micronuciformis]|nr:glycosyl transferase family 1 [Megasphaera micronuciformis]
MRILHCLAQLPMKTGSGVYFDTVLRYMDERGHKNAALYGVQAPFDPDLPCMETFPVVFNSDVLPFPIAGMSDEMPYDSTVFGAMSDEDLQLY